jgi:FMN phosphatase YigB (HAD superfamily)
MKKQVNIKTVIFDWGRTLWDPDQGDFFPGAEELLNNFSTRYQLILVPLASKGEEEIVRRRQILADRGFEKYFAEIVFVPSEKDEAYASVFRKYNFVPNEVVIVDDRMIRGIAWGNRVGAHTVWFQNGKFKDELPDKETGDPTHTITCLLDLKELL